MAIRSNKKMNLKPWDCKGTPGLAEATVDTNPMREFQTDMDSNIGKQPPMLRIYYHPPSFRAFLL